MRRKDCPAPFIKECLAQALFQLMKTKDFEDVTISEICKVAGFGRTTYYHYFTNKKEELIVYLCEKRWKEEIPHYNSEDDFDAWSHSVINYLYKHGESLTLLFKQGLLDVAFSVLFNGIRQTLSVCENEYSAAYVAGMYYGIVTQWVKDGFKLTPSQLIDAVWDGRTEVVFKRNH